MQEIRMKAFAVDEVSPFSGRIIPRAVAERAINEYNEKFVSQRRAFGECGQSQDYGSSEIHLSNVSHLVTSIQIEGNDVMVNAEILDTPMGIKVQEMLTKKVPLRIGYRGIGYVEDTTVKDDGFTLISFDIIPKVI